MKRTKYGKNPNKTIYIAPNTQDEKDWKEVVDIATESGEGIGAILMECWRRVKKKQNHNYSTQHKEGIVNMGICPKCGIMHPIGKDCENYKEKVGSNK